MARWSWESFGWGLVVGMLVCGFVVIGVRIPGVTE
jgi:hypothetical protein